MARIVLVAAVAVVAGAGGLGPGAAAIAHAAPSGQSSAQETIDELRGDGNRVILNKVGNGPLDQCSVTAVRPGSDVKHSWIQRGPTGNVNSLVRYKTVYVDLMCQR